MVGAILDGHLTEVGHAIVLAVPSATTWRVKETTFGEAGIFAKVKEVIDVVRDILNNEPVETSIDVVAAIDG